jgi:nitrate reductase delta subunit
VQRFTLGTFKESPEQLRALERVKCWTRTRFELSAEVPVLVSELACNRPNCSPLETLVAFWTENGERHHFKIFKPAEAVVFEDLPATWLADSLFAGDGVRCTCC